MVRFIPKRIENQVCTDLRMVKKKSYLQNYINIAFSHIIVDNVSSILDYQHMHLGKNLELLKSCMHLAGSCLLGMGEKEHLSGKDKILCF